MLETQKESRLSGTMKLEERVTSVAVGVPRGLVSSREDVDLWL